MKIAVVGSRTFNNAQLFCTTLNQYHQQGLELISGGANGADNFAYQYAGYYKIPITLYLPNFTTVKYTAETGYPILQKIKWAHKGAALQRNTTIVQNSDLVIAFWDGTSHGTADTIKKAEQLGKQVIKIMF